MDQGTMIFGERSKLLHARFFDLKTDEIPSTVQLCEWPSDWKVVVANSRAKRFLADPASAVEYALPRLGCALAMPVLRAEARSRGLAPDDEYSWGAEATLSLLKIVP